MGCGLYSVLRLGVLRDLSILLVRFVVVGIVVVGIVVVGNLFVCIRVSSLSIKPTKEFSMALFLVLISLTMRNNTLLLFTINELYIFNIVVTLLKSLLLLESLVEPLVKRLLRLALRLLELLLLL